MFEDIFPEEDYFQESSFVRVYRRETRVTSALTISALDAFRRGQSVGHLSKFFTDNVRPNEEQLTLDYQKFFYNIFWTKNTSRNFISPIDSSIINEVVKSSTSHWARIDYKIDMSLVNRRPILCKLQMIRDELERSVKFLSSSTEPIKNFQGKDYNWRLECTEDWIKVYHGNSYILIPWLCLIAFQDSIIGLIDVLLHTFVEDTLYKTDRFEFVTKLIEIVLSSIEILGKNIYKLLKDWLPATVGNLINNEGNDFDNALYNEVMDELPECPLKEYFRIQLIDRPQKTRAIAMAGLSKCFTYPIVNIQSAVDNVVSKSIKFHAPFQAGLNCLAMFRKVFIRQFIRKHKRWPPVNVIGEIPGDLRLAIDQDSWTERDGEWHPDIFLNIEILECLDFNWFVDAEELLADKSLAVGIESWPQEYDTRYHYPSYGHRCDRGPKGERRVILEHIKREKVDTRESVMKVKKNQMSPNPINMVVMCLKERELNEDKGRYYTKMIFDYRIDQNLTESNIKTIFKYFPFQSMTMSGLSLQQYMLQASSKRKLHVSLDFSKWCLNQTAALNVPTCQQLDKIFGLPGMYESTQFIPLNTYCFFQDRAYIPEQLPSGRPKIGPRVVVGLKSLGQGIYQKLWTLTTANSILYHMYDTGYKISLMGTGDNQVLQVEIPENVPSRVVQMDILDALHEMSESAELPIKVEETYGSKSYYEYNRNSYLDGKKVGLGEKKSSRIGTESQEIVPSINSRLSSIHSTAVACAAESILPIPAYIVALYESMRAITSTRRMDPDKMAASLILTRSLGGLKVTNYSSYCIRGIVDNAAENLSYLRFILNSQDYPLLTSGIMSSPIYKKRINWRSVVKDPYALPMGYPDDGDSYIRDLVEENLPDLINNQHIKPLLTPNAKSSEKILIDDLKTIQPPSLKLMASLYQYSNPALRERAVGRFESSTSVNQVILSTRSMKELYDKATAADLALVEFYNLRRKNGILSILASTKDCPTSVLDKFRRESTSMDLVTPSMPPPTHQYHFKRWSEVTTAETQFAIKVVVDASILVSLSMRGVKNAYLGSDTRIKRTKSPLEVYNPDSIDKSVLSLAELASWIGNDINLTNLIDRLISEKTNTNPEIIRRVSRQVVGGTFEHRGHLMILGSGAYVNYDPNIMSHISVITDTATAFARKAGDYSIMFQLLKVTVGSNIIHRFIGGYDVVGDWACVLDCGGCTRPVYEGNFSLPRNPLYPGLLIGREHQIIFNHSEHQLGEGDPYIGGHVYIAEDLARTAIDWERLELIMPTDDIDTHELRHNSSCNLSEISRCDVETLMKYMFAHLAMYPDVIEMISQMLYRDVPVELTPTEMIMNTLLLAGHSQNITSLCTGSMSHTLESRISRQKTFLYLFRTYYKSWIKDIKYVLPTESPETMVKYACLTCTDPGLEEGYWELFRLHDDKSRGARMVLDISGIQVAMPHDQCIKAIRGHPSEVKRDNLCRLKNDIKGGKGIVGKWKSSNITTYGLSPLASQLWSLNQIFPSYSFWTIEDHFGSWGIVLGHTGQETYIWDNSPAKYVHARTNNGPLSLSHDRCTSSYHRDYYINNLGGNIPKRPTSDPLIIISIKDPRETAINSQLLESDIWITRQPVGEALIGYPRRFASDIWYWNQGVLTDLNPENITIKGQVPPIRFYEGHSLSPHHRAHLLFRSNVKSISDILTMINEEIAAWDIRDKAASSTSDVYSKFSQIKNVKRKFTSETDLLFLYWTREVLLGETKVSVKWHMSDTGGIHINKSCCQDKKDKKFQPRDTLIATYIYSLKKH